MCECGKTVKWWKVWMVSLFVSVQCLPYTQGEIYSNKRMETVTTFNGPSQMNTICVVPLNRRPKVAMKIELNTLKIGSGIVYSTGEVFIRSKLLLPIHTTHRVTIQHLVDDDTLHILKVLLDGNEVEFTQSGDLYAWSDQYHFDHIALNLKGTADITPCENPTEPPITSPTTTTTTTPTTTTTTTKLPTTAVSTTTRIAETTTTPIGDKRNLDRFPYISLKDNSTNGESEGHNSSSVSVLDDVPTGDGGGDPWWHFIFILGDIKGIPVLILLIIVFCVGLGIGSVTTILCEQYCCRNDDDDDDDYKPHEYIDNSTVYSTDFTKPLANSAIPTNVEATTITKDRISGPILTRFSDTYSTPSQSHSGSMAHEWRRDSRERTYRSNNEETLPLNTSLRQEIQTDSYDPYN